MLANDDLNLRKRSLQGRIYSGISITETQNWKKKKKSKPDGKSQMEQIKQEFKKLKNTW